MDKQSQGNGLHVNLLMGGLLVIATLIVFWPIRTHKFITYDGEAFVTNNEYVQAGLTWKSVTWAFTTIYTANWHPLTWLSHMLDCQLYGLDPRGHHLTNVFFHLTNTLLLFGFLRRTTGAVGRSTVVAALFAVHPLHVESVAWIAERKDVLSAFFGMLTMWAYVRYTEQPGLARYLPVLLALTLGLLAKPMLVTLPFVLLLLDYWPLRRFAGSRAPRNRQGWLLLREKIPLLCLAAASSVVTFAAQRADGSVASLDQFALWTRVANALVSYAVYIQKMVWPTGLTVFYPYHGNDLPIGHVVGAIFTLASITLIVLFKTRRAPYLVVGWLWYLGTLVPVIGLVQVGQQAMADRYTYIPLIGLFVMVVWGIWDLLARWHYRRFVLSVVALSTIMVLMARSWDQVRLWQDNWTLFQHALAVTSRDHVAHYMIAGELVTRGNHHEAMDHYAATIMYRPDWAEARNNLAVLLEADGKIDEAIEQYKAALRYKPRYALAHNNLGVLLARKNQDEEAVAHYEAALRIDPALVDAHRNLALLLARQGKMEEAAHHLSAILR